MLRYLFIFLFTLFLISTATYADNMQLKIEGLSGDLEKNVQVRLSTMKPEEIRNDSQFRKRVHNAVNQGLRALGYYHPTIDFMIDNCITQACHVLRARVNKGQPVRIAGDNIILQGSALTDEDFLMLVKIGRPMIGEILNHGKYDRFKNSLINLSLRKGYFDADISRSQLIVVKDMHRAFWDIDFNSGFRYRFGEIKFKGSQIREDYLYNIIPCKPGDYYSAERLVELERYFFATNWFQSVLIFPNFINSKKNMIVPLNAWVTPTSRNTIEAGIGYSTDVGPRVKGLWKKPWINNRGHSLETSASISASEQKLNINYKIPLLNNPLEQYYLLQGSFKNIDLNDTNSVTAKMLASRNWNFSRGWQQAINLTCRLDHFTQGAITNTTMLLYSGVSLNRTRSRGGLMPIWGDSQRYSIDVSSTTLGSRINFALLKAQNVWIRTLRDKHRIIAHWQIGWIKTNHFDKMPPDLRFFAGGDRSIRGYKYKGISSRDHNLKLIGASKMLTGSLEYQYNVMGKWWSAVFFDAGEALQNIKKCNIKTSTGIGMRWQSPVGAVKIDIVIPMGDKSTHGMQLHIGFGPEL